MAPSVRIARPGDGAGIARVWLDSSAYYAELDPGHFKVPDAHGLAELTDGQLGVSDDRALSLVAEVWKRLSPGAAHMVLRWSGWIPTRKGL
jgi:hypothetical protein